MNPSQSPQKSSYKFLILATKLNHPQTLAHWSSTMETAQEVNPRLTNSDSQVPNNEILHMGQELGTWWQWHTAKQFLGLLTHSGQNLLSWLRHGQHCCQKAQARCLSLSHRGKVAPALFVNKLGEKSFKVQYAPRHLGCGGQIAEKIGFMGWGRD